MDPTDIKKVSKYCEQLSVYKFNSLISHFLCSGPGGKYFRLVGSQLQLVCFTAVALK